MSLNRMCVLDWTGNENIQLKLEFDIYRIMTGMGCYKDNTQRDVIWKFPQ